MSMSRAEAERRFATQRDELAELYAKVAGTPAGAKVLSDIANDLAGGEVVDASWPAYRPGGQAHDAVGNLARLAAARRIQTLTQRGRAGPAGD